MARNVFEVEELVAPHSESLGPEPGRCSQILTLNNLNASPALPRWQWQRKSHLGVRRTSLYCRLRHPVIMTLLKRKQNLNKTLLKRKKRKQRNCYVDLQLCQECGLPGQEGHSRRRGSGCTWVERQCPPMAISCNCSSSTLILQQSFSYCSPQIRFLEVFGRAACLQSLLPSLASPCLTCLVSIWKGGALCHFNSIQNEVQGLPRGVPTVHTGFMRGYFHLLILTLWCIYAGVFPRVCELC